MKKIIFLTVLVVGMVLTMGPGSKLVAGDRAQDVIEAIVNSTRQLQEASCRAQRVVARDSGSENRPQKCDSNDIYIDWDVILNFFAEYFACRKENGDSECAIDYCKCLLKIDDGWDPSKQNGAMVVCEQNLSSCETDRLIEKVTSIK